MLSQEAWLGRLLHEHRFLSKEINEEKWYRGQVVMMKKHMQEYEVEYNGEEESCKFDLTIDCMCHVLHKAS